MAEHIYSPSSNSRSQRLHLREHNDSGLHGEASKPCSKDDDSRMSSIDLERGKAESYESSDRDGSLDLLSTFGITPRHPLRKAVSTTFKSLSNSIRSKAQAIYNGKYSEDSNGFADSARPSESDRQQGVLQRMSNSLSRSSARVFASFRDKQYRRRSVDPVFVLDPADISLENECNPSINVDFPQPVFSSLHLEYPWLDTVEQRQAQASKIPQRSSSVGSTPEDRPIQHQNSEEQPDPDLVLSEDFENTRTIGNATAGELIEHTPVEEFEAKQGIHAKDLPSRSSCYDADIDSNDPDDGLSFDTSRIGPRDEWIKTREERQRRYELVSSMSPARASLDSNSTIAATFISTEQDPFLDEGSSMHCSDGEKEFALSTLPSATALGCKVSTQQTERGLENIPTYVIKTPLPIRLKPNRFSTAAIDRLNGYDLECLDVEGSPSPPLGSTLFERASTVAMPSIDAKLESDDPQSQFRGSAGLAKRPDFNRQISVLSAESAEECAVTSKSRLRMSDIQGSAEHHRQASVDHSKQSRDAVRLNLSKLSLGERDFVVDDPSSNSQTSEDISPCDLGPVGYPAVLGSRPIRAKIRASPMRMSFDSDAVARFYEENHPFRSATASTCSDSSRSSTPSPSPYRRSRVSFVLPSDHSPSPRASKDYRRPSPCPKWIPSPTKIPAPTYHSPNSPRRKTVSFVSLSSTATNDSKHDSASSSTEGTVVDEGHEPGHFAEKPRMCLKLMDGTASEEKDPTSTPGGGNVTTVPACNDTLFPSEVFAEAFPVSALKARRAPDAGSWHDGDAQRTQSADLPHTVSRVAAEIQYSLEFPTGLDGSGPEPSSDRSLPGAQAGAMDLETSQSIEHPFDLPSLPIETHRNLFDPPLSSFASDSGSDPDRTKPRSTSHLETHTTEPSSHSFAPRPYRTYDFILGCSSDTTESDELDQESEPGDHASSPSPPAPAPSPASTSTPLPHNEASNRPSTPPRLPSAGTIERASATPRKQRIGANGRRVFYASSTRGKWNPIRARRSLNF